MSSINKFILRVLDHYYRTLPYWAYPTFIYKWRVKLLFKEKHGYSLDLNNPHTFNEKIQWYKFNYYDEQMRRCVDKLKFKDYVIERLGKDFSAKTLDVWDSADDLEKAWDSLPKSFCIKSNCIEMSDGVIIITDKEKFEFDQIRPQIEKWFIKKDISRDSIIRTHRNKIPKVFVEEYIGNDNILIDYKFYCFDGKPYCSNATQRRFVDGKPVDEGIAFYDNNWNVKNGNVADRIYRVVEKPANLDDMLDMARKLSSGFPFARVDLYFTNNRIYTGEMEFYPGGGFGKYEPYEFDLEMGNQFVLPNKN